MASEARFEGEVAGGLDAVELVVIHRRKVDLGAGFHVHVAGGAGATSAAGMLELDAEIQGHIQDRFGFPMLLVGKFSGLELDRAADI